VKDGGLFQNQDGDKGTFLRVRQNKDLRMTFENADLSSPTQVDVQFQDKGKGKTGLLVNHTRIQTRGEADGLRAAWGQALEHLKAVCEGKSTKGAPRVDRELLSPLEALRIVW